MRKRNTSLLQAVLYITGRCCALANTFYQPVHPLHRLYQGLQYVSVSVCPWNACPRRFCVYTRACSCRADFVMEEVHEGVGGKNFSFRSVHVGCRHAWLEKLPIRREDLLDSLLYRGRLYVCWKASRKIVIPLGMG